MTWVKKALDLLRLALPVLQERVPPFLRAHWKAVTVGALACVAALGVRGCARERGRADAADAQLDAQFKAALWIAKQVPELAVAVAAEEKQGGKVVAVFSGSSAEQRVPAQSPAAAKDPTATPAAGAPPERPCALHVGDGFKFHLDAVTVRRKDGGHLVLGDVSLDSSTGLHLAGVVDAPVTLPAPDPPVVAAVVERARWRARFGLVQPWAPSGAYAGGGVRLFSSRWWLEADARATAAERSVALGLAREW